MSDIYYTITPTMYKDGDYQTGTRRDRAETKLMRAELKRLWHKGGDRPFATKLEAKSELLRGLKKARSEYSADDFVICETSDWIL